MDKPPVDVIVSGIDKLGISANCKDYGKSALYVHFLGNHKLYNYEVQYPRN